MDNYSYNNWSQMTEEQRWDEGTIAFYETNGYNHNEGPFYMEEWIERFIENMDNKYNK